MSIPEGPEGNFEGFSSVPGGFRGFKGGFSRVSEVCKWFQTRYMCVPEDSRGVTRI